MSLNVSPGPPPVAVARGPRRGAPAGRIAGVDQPRVSDALRLLCDESAPGDWHEPAAALRLAGDEAFQPLLDAIAGAATREIRQRCDWAFLGLKLADRGRFASILDHPDPEVRETALQALGEDARRFVPAVAALIDDPVEEVRHRAIRTLRDIGEPAVPHLRSLRRSGGRRRRGALTALAGIGGWEALDEDDREAVERLIRIKADGEAPAPMHLCGFWYAIPTTDQAAVLDAFGLTGARPVTMRLGESAWNHDQHAGSRDPHGRCRRAYVSPAFDGWTLVFGDPPAVAHSADYSAALRDEVLSRTAALSGRFGAAHWYGVNCGDGWSAWCLASRGEVVRYYDDDDPHRQIGPPHASEDGLDRFEAYATIIAARASVDPSALGPGTRVSGRALLALTRCGVTQGAAPGALEI